MRHSAVSLPDNSPWNKPCTCKSVSGGSVVQRTTVGSAFSGSYESFVDLVSVWTETMKDGCGRDESERELTRKATYLFERRYTGE